MIELICARMGIKFDQMGESHLDGFRARMTSFLGSNIGFEKAAEADQVLLQLLEPPKPTEQERAMSLDSVAKMMDAKKAFTFDSFLVDRNNS